MEDKFPLLHHGHGLHRYWKKNLNAYVDRKQESLCISILYTEIGSFRCGERPRRTLECNIILFDQSNIDTEMKLRSHAYNFQWALIKLAFIRVVQCMQFGGAGNFITRRLRPASMNSWNIVVLRHIIYSFIRVQNVCIEHAGLPHQVHMNLQHSQPASVKFHESSLHILSHSNPILTWSEGSKHIVNWIKYLHVRFRASPTDYEPMLAIVPCTHKIWNTFRWYVDCAWSESEINCTYRQRMIFHICSCLYTVHFIFQTRSNIFFQVPH